MDRRQECGPEIAYASMTKGRIDCDKAGQVRVFGSQSVADPRPHTRSDKGVRAGVDFQKSSAVGFVGSMDRFEQREVINMLGDIGEQIAHPCTRLTVLLEGPRALEQIAGLRELNSRFWNGKGLAVQPDQLGLVVKGIDVGWTAVHEQEKDPFYLWRKVWLR